MPDPDTAEEVIIAHEIMNQFRYMYKDKWVAQKALHQKNRMHTKVFNDLVSKGFIKKKKTYSGHQYKWTGVFP